MEYILNNNTPKTTNQKSLLCSCQTLSNMCNSFSFAKTSNTLKDMIAQSNSSSGFSFGNPSKTLKDTLALSDFSFCGSSKSYCSSNLNRHV